MAAAGMGASLAQEHLYLKAGDRQPFMHPVRHLPEPLSSKGDRMRAGKASDTLPGLHSLLLLPGVLPPGRDHGGQGMGA